MIWDRKSPDREAKERSPWGWLFYRRVKPGKVFYRPMNRVVHAPIRSLVQEDLRPDAPVFLGDGARPNARFQALCGLAGDPTVLALSRAFQGVGGAIMFATSLALLADAFPPRERGIT